MIDFDLKKKDIKYFQNKIIIAGKNLYTPYSWRNTDNKFHGLTAEILSPAIPRRPDLFFNCPNDSSPVT